MYTEGKRFFDDWDFALPEWRADAQRLAESEAGEYSKACLLEFPFAAEWADHKNKGTVPDEERKRILDAMHEKHRQLLIKEVNNASDKKEYMSCLVGWVGICAFESPVSGYENARQARDMIRGLWEQEHPQSRRTAR